MPQFAFCLLCYLITNLPSSAQDEVIVAVGIKDSMPTNIHLRSKSMIKDNKILLQWNTTGKNGFYIVERSIDSNNFEIIGVIKGRPSDNSFEYMDERPLMKKSYYRIKMQAADEKNLYSEIVAAGITDSVFCKFYPNPVDKLLILRSNYSIGLKITDITGKIRIAQQLKAGLQILDVSCLEKNIYIITISQEETNQFISKKLIKN